MPELPEVETIKSALSKAVTGACIEDVKVFNRNFRKIVPVDFDKKTVNATILRVYRKAKYAILELSNGYSIVWHFGMSGKVKILQKAPETLEKHDHIVITTTKGTLIFNDTRRFGVMTYLSTQSLDEDLMFANLGVDPYEDEFTPFYLQNKFKSKNTPVKLALLDQSIISGIGNIYASEALYEARISPLRPCCNISFAELENLIKAIRFILDKAIKAGGSTLRDYRKPDGSTGYFQNQHCVYNKTGQRCPNCTCDIKKSGGIRKITQGGRSSFYCETLQK